LKFGLREKIVLTSFLAFLALCIVDLVLTSQMQQRTITSSGIIRTVDLEIDVATIDWGLIEPNETKTFTINVKPTGTVPVMLSINTSNWNPTNASDFVSLTWNYTGVALQPDVWYAIELHLYVAADIEGIETFSFDITIIASDA